MERPAPGSDREQGGILVSSVNGADLIQTTVYNQAVCLRAYQKQVLLDIAAEVSAGIKRIIAVAPTGAGKTVIFAETVRQAAEKGRSVLILVHRDELLQQTSRKLHDVGVDHGLIKAGYTARLSERVQVASVQTLHARAIRSNRIEMPPADLIVVDECHHARARTYQAILDAYPNATVVGFTATPCRGDGRGLGNLFESMVQCPQVAELTGLGYLVPAKIYAPSQPDLKGVRVSCGDYAEAELAKRVDTQQLVGDVVTHYLRLAQGRRTVVFAVNVAHSIHLRDEFCRAGIAAEHVDGSTPAEERTAILRRFAAGEVDVLCNVGVLTEGWDCPNASCLVLARPTKSLGLYRQMVGRVLRPAAGKTDALILDHSGAVFEHGLPDDSIEWPLTSDDRAVNRAQFSGGQPQGLRIQTCPECSGIRLSGQPCAFCGWKPTRRASPVDVIDGDLQAVGAGGKSAAPDQTQFHAELLWIAQEKQYKPGWAAHKFKEKFGFWPPFHYLQPQVPDPSTRSWVRSRQIAYAKSRVA